MAKPTRQCSIAFPSKHFHLRYPKVQSLYILLLKHTNLNKKITTVTPIVINRIINMWQLTESETRGFQKMLLSFRLYTVYHSIIFQEWWNSSWPISNPERWCCETAALNMPVNLENSAVATGLEKVSFHSDPIESNAEECSNYRTIALISHTSKVMLKILRQASAIREPWTSRCSSWF